MAVASAFRCVCGAQKEMSPHWVLAKVTSLGVGFMPWDWNIARCEGVVPLCGAACASEFLSRSLGGWERPTSSIRQVEYDLAIANRLAHIMAFKNRT